jgi:hypothetical protein
MTGTYMPNEPNPAYALPSYTYGSTE